MNQLYYIELDSQQYGPYELEQVKEFGLFADTLVLVEGGEEWKTANEYPELAECCQEIAAVLDTLDIFNINYYYEDENGQLYGPLSIVELAYLDVAENTLLGINSMKNRHFASEIEGLVDILTRLSELDKENFDTELQKIKNEYKKQLDTQNQNSREIILNKQELQDAENTLSNCYDSQHKYEDKDGHPSCCCERNYE